MDSLPPSLAPLSRSGMPSFADAQFRLRSGELRRTRGMAPCLRLPVRIRTQTGATHRQAPHASLPPRPSEPRRHFHISDFMRALRTLRVLICGIGCWDGSAGRPSYYGGFIETRPTSGIRITPNAPQLKRNKTVIRSQLSVSIFQSSEIIPFFFTNNLQLFFYVA